MTVTTRRRRGARRAEAARANLREFTDRDLMLVVAECEDADGFVDTRAIADILNIDHPRRNQCVGTRFRWMSQFGLLAKHPNGKMLWTITPSGRDLIARNPADIGTSGQDAEWAAVIAANAMRISDHGMAAVNMARREFQHHLRQAR